MNREIKFRVWDGEKMLDPDEATRQGFVLWPDGSLLHKEAFGGVSLQYTGVKDANGVEVYEGDLLDDPKGEYISGEVVCIDGCFGVQLRYDLIFLPFAEMTEQYLERIKVIGNAFDHPELLKQPA